MKKIYLILCFLAGGLQLFAQDNKPLQQYKLIGKGSVQAKNYYLLTLIQNNAGVRHLLENDPVLAKLLIAKQHGMRGTVIDCPNYICYIHDMIFHDNEIAIVNERLAALYSPDNALGKLVRNELVPSGTYALYKHLTLREILIKAWETEAQGINQAISVYATGKKPNYPAIDSISFNVKTDAYFKQMHDWSASIADATKNDKLFFMPSLTAALTFLNINERAEAATDEPLAETVNRAAVEKVKTVDWNKYKYSVILVPGAGPGLSGMALSAGGKMRCKLGARQYFEGLAPFIMPSGGRVHPFKTKYCEADEMKKYLVDSLHVPASAIIVEPQARHTTTNLRNGIRLMFHYGFPLTKAAITCTDKSQSVYIEKAMAERCMKELGYMPYKLGTRLSDTEQEFYPLIESLQINPLEPLDP
ncbi:YdcF family protein [Mucilaginibacter sp. AW1-3]